MKLLEKAEWFLNTTDIKLSEQLKLFSAFCKKKIFQILYQHQFILLILFYMKLSDITMKMKCWMM